MCLFCLEFFFLILIKNNSRLNKTVQQLRCCQPFNWIKLIARASTAIQVLTFWAKVKFPFKPDLNLPSQQPTNSNYIANTHNLNSKQDSYINVKQKWLYKMMQVRQSSDKLKSVQLSSVIKLCSKINLTQQQHCTRSRSKNNKILSDLYLARLKLIHKNTIICKASVKSPRTKQQPWKINCLYNTISVIWNWMLEIMVFFFTSFDLKSEIRLVLLIWTKYFQTRLFQRPGFFRFQCMDIRDKCWDEHVWIQIRTFPKEENFS